MRNRRAFEQVFIYPPLRTLKNITNGSSALSNLASAVGRHSSLYVHVPFCPGRQRCHYCHYAAYVGASAAQQSEYIDALRRERAFLLERGLFADRVSSILHVGGGTPTCLSPDKLRILLGWVGDWSWTSPENNIEFTCEAHPKTLLNSQTNPGRDRLLVMAESGVNRLSIGVQDLHDDVLGACGRIHTARDVRQSFIAARDKGFGNINFDLIYGLPGQTADTWRETIQEVVAMGPECVTTYHLRVKRGTPIARMGARALPSLDECWRMLQISIESLCEAGYEHVLGNQFARPGFKYRYEVDKYLPSRDVIGIGLSAYSVLSDRAYYNAREIRPYECAIYATGCPITAWRELTAAQQQSRMVVLALRRPLHGVSKSEFLDHFGEDLLSIYGHAVDRLVGEGMLEDTSDCIRLTQQGLQYADEVCIRFYDVATQAILARKGIRYGLYPV